MLFVRRKNSGLAFFVSVFLFKSLLFFYFNSFISFFFFSYFLDLAKKEQNNIIYDCYNRLYLHKKYKDCYKLVIYVIVTILYNISKE